jgi:hypothetical protein
MDVVSPQVITEFKKKITHGDGNRYCSAAIVEMNA